MTDAWFIYLKKLDDVITWDGAFHSRKDDEVYIREQEEGEVAGGWTLATIKDREAARLFYRFRNGHLRRLDLPGYAAG